MTPDDMTPASPGATRPAETRQPDLRPDLRTGLLVVVAVILVVWALRATAVVLVPLVAAILIALAVMPVRDWVTRRVPGWLSWLGPITALLLLIAILSVFVAGLTIAARQLVAEIGAPNGALSAILPGDDPESLAEAAEAGAEQAADTGALEREAAAAAEADGAGTEAEDAGTPGALLQQFGDRALGAAGGIAAAFLNAATAGIAGLVVMLFFTLLILFESGTWRRKMRAVADGRAQWRLLESADVIAGKVRAYFLVQGAIGLTTALLYGAWLWFWGIELVLVWVVISFLLNFIPTLGALISGLLPVAYTLLTRDFGTALAVGAGILAIEQVMGNFVEPRFQGRNIALSPLVILVTLAFWAWVWGIAGALLAVPVTVALVVLGSHVAALRPWALMLTDQTDMEGLREVTRPE